MVVGYGIKISAGIGAGRILDGIIVGRREIQSISSITSYIVPRHAAFGGDIDTMGLVLIGRAVGYAGSGGRNTTATVLVGCAIDHGGVRHIKAVGTVMVGCAIGYAGGRRGRNAVESVMKSHTAGYGRTEAMKTVRAVIGCRTIGYTCGRVGRNPVETIAVNIQIPDQIIAAIKKNATLFKVSQCSIDDNNVVFTVCIDTTTN